MLGRSLMDPDGIEGAPGSMPGLGLLDVATVLTDDKTLTEVEGVSVADGSRFHGYEMHVGRTEGPDCDRPLLRFTNGRSDGASSADGLIRGTYVHGLFADDAQRASCLSWIGGASSVRYEQEVDRTLDLLADHLEAHCDLDRLLTIAR
jgi:adenosylcobyric acid synthase